MTLKIVPVGEVTANINHCFIEKTLTDVVKKISTLPEAGKADWSVKYSIPCISGNQIEKFDLIFSLTMKLPVWTNYSIRPEKEKNEWDHLNSRC